ncbi:MAG: hypothetical protein E7555_07915 [Ruminococcaceae bacterium]|nr:hypothetical protein [Oscillospiraceae bacterium]
MKKFKKLIAILMAALMVFALSSCDLIEDAPITPALGGVEAGDIRIGILFAEDYESEGTASFVQQQAINTMWGTYGIAGTIPKNKVPVDNIQKIQDQIISCVKESGCNVVLSTDPAFTKIAYEFSQNADYKNIIFVCLDSTKEYEATENFHCFYPDYAQAYKLAGIAAAAKLGNTNIPLTEENEEYAAAFAEGVKSVAPKAKVINGKGIDTYGEIVTNWHVYYITLIENITLGNFSEMGDYYAGTETGFCDFVAAEDYVTDEGEAKMSEARLAFCEAK